MNTKDNFSFPVLEHPAPQCDTNEARELANDWIETGEDTTITPLVSERDRNFLISTGGEKAILKISNHKEKKGVLESEPRNVDDYGEPDVMVGLTRDSTEAADSGP